MKVDLSSHNRRSGNLHPRTLKSPLSSDLSGYNGHSGIKDMKGRRPKNSKDLVDEKGRSLNSSRCKLKYRQDHALRIAQPTISAALEHNVDSKLLRKDVVISSCREKCSSETRLPVLRTFSSGLDHRSYFSVTTLESNFFSRPAVVIISASTMVKK
jgi:hypothetical protein